MLRLREFIKTREQVFKVGRTVDIARRLREYPKDSRLLLSVHVRDVKSAERDVMRRLKNNFQGRSDIGKEYFEGDACKICDEILRVTQYYRSPDSE